ncbi:MAG: hypothetical protein WBN66_13710 [Smithella sp.]
MIKSGDFIPLAQISLQVEIFYRCYAIRYADTTRKQKNKTQR